MRKIIIAMFSFAILSLPHKGWSWDDRTTHQELSEKAVANSIFKSNKNILENFGLDDGLNSWLTSDGKSKKIIDWFRYGGLMEDESLSILGIQIEPIGRFYNHFHNPLEPWDQAGLDSIVNGESTFLWAQDDANNDEWAWQKVREYYRLALTAPSEADRSANFAKTFRGLGQAIHLIEDMAQPRMANLHMIGEG